MKKASISIFALLAIVFAVASAFTTTKNTLVQTGWYSASTLVHSGSAPYNELQFPNFIGSDLIADRPVLGEGPCSDQEEFVCAAYFNNSTSSSDIVLGGIPE